MHQQSLSLQDGEVNGDVDSEEEDDDEDEEDGEYTCIFPHYYFFVLRNTQHSFISDGVC